MRPRINGLFRRIARVEGNWGSGCAGETQPSRRPLLLSYFLGV